MVPSVERNLKECRQATISASVQNRFILENTYVHRQIKHSYSFTPSVGFFYYKVDRVNITVIQSERLKSRIGVNSKTLTPNKSMTRHHEDPYSGSYCRLKMLVKKQSS